MAKRVRNRTKFDLRIEGANSQQILLAPLEHRDLSDDEMPSYNDIQLTRHRLVSVDDIVTSERVNLVLGLRGEVEALVPPAEAQAAYSSHREVPGG